MILSEVQLFGFNPIKNSQFTACKVVRNSANIVNAFLKHFKQESSRDARPKLRCHFVGNRSDCCCFFLSFFLFCLFVNLCSRLQTNTIK